MKQQIKFRSILLSLLLLSFVEARSSRTGCGDERQPMHRFRSFMKRILPCSLTRFVKSFAYFNNFDDICKQVVHSGDFCRFYFHY